MSNANFDPQMTTTLVIGGEGRRGMLAARERVWNIGGVKDAVGKGGRYGVEVRPVVMMSLEQLNEVLYSVDTVQVLSALAM